ncbi:MAG: TIGR04255 family protein [Gemmatimonadetes bacterium]|nr:TIGR04255 family protein [Gemmatimonadota bacterium]
MATIRHLDKAPLNEAIVDLRAIPRPAFRPDAFNGLRERLRDAYPTVEERRFFEARFEFKAGKDVVPESKEMGIQGYFFKSVDGLSIAQFRIDGFTFNRLPPYTSWKDIKPEALRLWKLYCEVTNPEKLERVALRYINRMRVPPKGDLSAFLNVGVPRFPGSPEYVGEFLVRVSSHDPATGNQANVVLALQRPSGAPEADLILDIDVYRMSGLTVNDVDLVPMLDQLHSLKNEIFFGSITEETARLYE